MTSVVWWLCLTIAHYTQIIMISCLMPLSLVWLLCQKKGMKLFRRTKNIFNNDWVYADKPQTEKEKNDKAEDFMTAIAKKAYNKNLTIKNFIPGIMQTSNHFTWK